LFFLYNIEQLLLFIYYRTVTILVFNVFFLVILDYYLYITEQSF
ncbi:unnamed protein product, partial [Rotaria sp. Silwood2]